MWEAVLKSSWNSDFYFMNKTRQGTPADYSCLVDIFYDDTTQNTRAMVKNELSPVHADGDGNQYAGC